MMKNFLLLFLFLPLTFLTDMKTSNAAGDVTFCVDLTCFSSITAPTVFGSFNGWNAGANPITDPDADGTYCATINLADGDHEYKFFFQEEGPEDMTPGDPCTITTSGFTNRILTVAGGPLSVDFGWESCDGVCSAPPMLPVPLVAAPDPTAAQACVISMFSGVYADVGVDTWLTVWSQAALTDIQVAGNDTKLYENVNFLGIETTGGNLIDASGMEFFNIDIWTPNMTEFRVKLVDFGADGNFGGGDDSEHELAFPPTPEAWVTYEIPLASFVGLNSTTNIAQLILSGNPSGAGTLYVDNVYFSKPAPLPVELNSFEANIMEDKVRVEWTTASEINSDYFQVERSSDGRSFEPIAKVSSTGNSTQLQSYQILDRRPFAGINYYRLTQVDLDGTEEKSNIVSVRMTSNNPKFELMRKSINGEEVSLDYKIADAGTYTMAVIDISGKILSQETMVLTEGINGISQRIPNSGVFIVVLTNGRDRIIEKVFK